MKVSSLRLRGIHRANRSATATDSPSPHTDGDSARLHLSSFLSLAVLFTSVFLGSCGSDSTSEGRAFDPSQPVKLTEFYPDSGVYQTKVILRGTNFGTDPSAIRVYFNAKQAAVIGTTGDELYVQAPRLPGDTCAISVAVGSDSVTYPKTFIYHKTVTVSTIAGNGVTGGQLTGGQLSGTIIAPRYLCVDMDGNIFVSSRGTGDESGSYGFCRIDEANDEMDIITTENCNAPCADPTTGVISVPTETATGSFLTMDPAEFWSPRHRDFKWPNDYSNIPANGYKHCMVVNPEDGYIYTRYYYGDVVKINPKTYEVTKIAMTSIGDSYGLTFNPKHPGTLFISMWSNGGAFANSICAINLHDSIPTMVRLSSVNTAGGHRDGRLEKAQFRCPAQIFCDSDGNMYVADCDNHCIRRISPDGMVETVLGIPGTRGWKDGGKDDALFNNPRGIGVAADGTVYVGDLGNGRVRKMTIN